MPSHAPPGYRCSFCALVSGGENDHNSQSDVVWRDELMAELTSPKWWEPNRADTAAHALHADRLRAALRT